MGRVRYFLDTYALVEIVRGNVNYQKFLGAELFTSVLNLYELFYNILRDYGEEKAKELFYEFSDILIPLKEDYIFAAAQFKLKHKASNISYADALGYTIAVHENMKFLTGDKEFEHITNVEFVK